MTPEELREIIKQPEGAKLDFKREFYKLGEKLPINKRPIEDKEKQEYDKAVSSIKQKNKLEKNELIKDIIALTNGDKGTPDQDAFLIIGVGDNQSHDGKRELYDVPSSEELSTQKISSYVNEACDPTIQGIQCDFVELDDKNIYIIKIPASQYVHEITRELKTKDHTYLVHTVFYRKGEQVRVADYRKRLELEREKGILSKQIDVRFDCGSKLREIREDIGLSISEFIELIQFPSQKAYERVEKEEIDVPLSILERVVSLTGVSIEWLKHGDKTTSLSRLKSKLIEKSSDYERTKFNVEPRYFQNDSHVDEIIEEIGNLNPEWFYFMVYAPDPSPYETTHLCLVVESKQYHWKIFNCVTLQLYRRKYISETFYFIKKLNQLFKDKKYVIYGLFLSPFEINQLTSGVIHPKEIIGNANHKNNKKMNMRYWPIDILDINHKNSSEDTYEEWYGQWFIESQRYYKEALDYYKESQNNDE